MKTTLRVTMLVLALAGPAAAQMQHDKAAMDHRGHQAMGWDQSRATHTFTPSSDGGRIEVAANDAADAVTIAAIRAHLSEIAKAFKAGDFDKPMFIHAETPPGVPEMTRLKAAISYTYEDLPRGGRVTIASTDATAVEAVHAFLKFQQQEHASK